MKTNLVPVTDEVRKLNSAVDAWVELVLLGGPPKQLIVCGRNGTGKTHSLNAARRYINDHAIEEWDQHGRKGSPARTATIRWLSIAQLKEEAFAEAIREAREATAVLLDDIGAEVDQFACGSPANRLQRILDLRKHLFATTNIPPKEWPTKWNERVASRLCDGTIVELWNTPDYRITRTVFV